MSIAREAVSCWEMRGHRGGILILVIDPPECFWSASQCLSPRVCCLWYQSREATEDHLLSPDGQSRGQQYRICYDLYFTSCWKWHSEVFIFPSSETNLCLKLLKTDSCLFIFVFMYLTLDFFIKTSSIMLHPEDSYPLQRVSVLSQVSSCEFMILDA